MPASNPNMINYGTLFPANTPGSNIPGGIGAAVNSPTPNTPYTINFGLTGPGSNVKTGTTPNIPLPAGNNFTANNTNPLNLNFGPIGGTDKDLPNKLNHLFGGGMGATVLQMLQSGGFSPQDAQAFINAMLPQEARGRESVLNSFGNLGLRDSSSAEIGLGDFESQFASQEMATLAGMRENATNRSFNLLSQIMPTAAGSKANETSTFDMISQALGLFGSAVTGIPGLSNIGLPGGGTLGGLFSGKNAQSPNTSMTTATSDYGMTAGGVPFAGTNEDWSGLTSLDPFSGFLDSTSPGII